MRFDKLFRVIAVQLVAVVAGSAVSAVFGAAAAGSALAGGLCVVVPGCLVLGYAVMRQQKGLPISPAGVLVCELLKVAVITALFVAVAKLIPGLNWPGMVFGIIVGACSQLPALLMSR